LAQLVKDGYEVEVRDGSLLIGHVPCRLGEGTVGYGTLFCPLDLAGNATAQPTRHEMWFVGAVPHDSDGAVIANEGAQARPDASCTISRKPVENDGKYQDFHHKVTTYLNFISGPAREIDGKATAKTAPVYVDDDGDASVFNYIDTASSRAGISEATNKLKSHSVAIVGLGGTGSYILDYLSKTPVEHIHLYDGDCFLQHNAFRSPGAPSLEDLQQEELTKVAWFSEIYARIRKNIHPHDYVIDDSNADELREMDFVFIAADSGKAKRLLARKLEEWGVPFIDVGMGLYDVDSQIGGQLRVTTSTPDFHDHVTTNHRISFAAESGEEEAENVYDLNIQVAELNALNAALAIIKWKKLCGFYLDDTFEHHSIYVVNGNAMINEDRAE
jgi:hypothetical protein